MRLSEAMRLGAMLAPQGFRGLRVLGKTCAIGAAYEAVGIPCGAHNFSARNEANAMWPLLVAESAACPECGATSMRALPWPFEESIAGNIAHLNDAHKWTREQIADWVSGLEDAQAAKDGEAQAPGSVSTVNDAEILITVPK